jgi:hypothetical protein
VSEQAPFRFFFSIAPIASAFMRHADGGGRLKIDIDQQSVAEINRLLDTSVGCAGVSFVAVVLPVEVEAQEETPPPPPVIGWKERRKLKN